MKSTALILLTTVVLAGTVAACSGKDPGRPTPETTSGATETTSTSKKPASGPDLDLSKFAGDPCKLLKSDQLAQLGDFDPAKQRSNSLGPGCTWDPKDVTKGASYEITLSTKGNNLESMMKNAKTEPVFKETTVAGYPAFSSDGTNGKGNCGTYVGTSDKEAIVVQISLEDKTAPEYQDSCSATEKVAALVIQNLKG